MLPRVNMTAPAARDPFGLLSRLPQVPWPSSGEAKGHDSTCRRWRQQDSKRKRIPGTGPTVLIRTGVRFLEGLLSNRRRKGVHYFLGKQRARWRGHTGEELGASQPSEANWYAHR